MTDELLPHPRVETLTQGPVDRGEGYTLSYERGVHRVTAPSAAMALQGRCRTKMALANGMEGAFWGEQTPLLPTRALALAGTAAVAVVDGLTVSLPQEILEGAAAGGTARADALAQQTLALGFNTIVLGLSANAVAAAQKGPTPVQTLIEPLVRHGLKVVIAPACDAHYFRELTGRPWPEYCTALRSLAQRLRSLFPHAVLLWRSPWTEDERLGALRRWRLTTAEMVSEEARALCDPWSARLWYEPFIANAEDRWWWKRLPDSLPAGVTLLFSSSEKSSCLQGAPHFFWEELTRRPRRSATPLLPYLDVSAATLGGGLWPTMWPEVAREHVSNAVLCGASGLLAVSPALPQPRGWHWGLLWSFAQQLWSPRHSVKSYFGMWYNVVYGKQWEYTAHSQAVALTEVALKLHGLLHSEGDGVPTPRHHLEECVARLRPLEPPCSEPFADLWCLCYGELRRLLFHLMQCHQISTTLTVEQRDLAPGLLTQLTATVGQSVRKGLGIAFLPASTQEPEEALLREAWRRCHYFWEGQV